MLNIQFVKINIKDITGSSINMAIASSKSVTSQYFVITSTEEACIETFHVIGDNGSVKTVSVKRLKVITTCVSGGSDDCEPSVSYSTTIVDPCLSLI